MDEQVKDKKNIINLFGKNKKIFFSIVILIIITLSFFTWKDNINTKKKLELSEKYIDAKILLSQNKQDKKILKDLEEIILNKDSTYSVLSLYLIIDSGLQNDNKKILKYFREILSIKDLKKEDKNLIKLKQAIFISNKSNEKDLLDLLNPIINSDSVWKAQAILFMGDFYYSKKEFSKADQYYNKLLTIENSNINKSEIKNKIKDKK